jgi:hypothetical protein
MVQEVITEIQIVTGAKRKKGKRLIKWNKMGLLA